MKALQTTILLILMASALSACSSKLHFSYDNTFEYNPERVETVR